MKKLALSILALAALSMTPASALTVWDNLDGPPGGNVGPSESFGATSGFIGLQVTAYGFKNINTTPAAQDLYEKNLGSDEVGLGLTNDSSGQNEITVHRAILVDFRNAVNAGANQFSFQMNSTTPSGLPNGESWIVLGSTSTSATPPAFSTFTHTVATGTNDEALHTLGAAFVFNWYAFEVNGWQRIAGRTRWRGWPTHPDLSSAGAIATWGMMILGFMGLAFAFRQQAAQNIVRLITQQKWGEPKGSPSFVERVLAHGKARRLEREAQPRLLSTTAKTERNNEIVRLSRGGMSARKISERFAISPVSRYRHRS